MGVAYAVAKMILKILTSIFDKLNLSLSWVMCGILIIIIMLMRFKLKQYKTNLWTRLDNTSKAYYNFLHNYRNLYFEILSNHKNRNLNQKYLTELACNFLRNMLDKMCDIYTAYSGSKMVNGERLLSNGYIYPLIFYNMIVVSPKKPERI